MAIFKSRGWRGGGAFAAALLTLAAISSTALAAVSSTPPAASQESLIRISSDPYTNPDSQHKTEVEPSTFAFGNTIVAALQAGRFPDIDAGSSNIGWATSTDAGQTWEHGFLPGITKIDNPANPYKRATDPSVAYDRKHNVWLISSLPLVGASSPALIVSRSTNGGTVWGKPVKVHGSTVFPGPDEPQMVCDNTPTSPFYGHCYIAWDEGAKSLILISTSTDGGKTWSRAQTTANRVTGFGVTPAVQPNGRVVIALSDFNATNMLSFISTDGGASWSRTVRISPLSAFDEEANLKLRNSTGTPSVKVDGVGKVYTIWNDCRFEQRCKANDLVMSTSTDGVRWSTVQRIPTDPVGSGVDHLLPGLTIDPDTSGDSAGLGLSYYYLPNANCTPNTCQLNVGFISSTNGGRSWSNHKQLAGPMKLGWLPMSQHGRMIGDYISTSSVHDNAVPVFPVAHAPQNGIACHLHVLCDQAMYTTPQRIVGGQNVSNGARVVFASQSPQDPKKRK